jgi:hypothetical protein
LTLKNKVLRQLWPFDWVLGRHACLGFEVLRALNCNVKDFNSQKGRVDLLLAVSQGLSNTIDLGQIKNYLDRKDLLDLIGQQKYLNSLPRHAPKFILLDSYSELTDKLFEHKYAGWKFCCHNSDLGMTNSFHEEFSSHGLLDINLIESFYFRFIEALSIKYPQVPILFLHYPRALEERNIYLERSEVIQNSIEAISQKNKFLHQIRVDEHIVSSKCDADGNPDTYPYHYSPETYVAFARLITELAPFKGFCK